VICGTQHRCDENIYTLDYLTALPACLDNAPYQDNTELADAKGSGDAAAQEDGEQDEADGGEEKAAEGEAMPAGWYDPDDEEGGEEEEDDGVLPLSPQLDGSDAKAAKRKCPF
jgi:hypothetical protein